MQDALCAQTDLFLTFIMVYFTLVRGNILTMADIFSLEPSLTHFNLFTFQSLKIDELPIRCKFANQFYIYLQKFQFYGNWHLPKGDFVSFLRI